MDSNNDFTPEKILSMQWLTANNIALDIISVEIPKRYPLFFLCRALYRQIQHGKKTVIADQVAKAMIDLSKRSIINYADQAFVFKKVFAKAYREYNARKEEFENTPFRLIGKSTDSGNQIFDFTVTISELQTLKFSKSQTAQPMHLNVKRVMNIRKEQIESAEREKESTPDRIENIEEVALKICEDYAAGIYTITECCDTYGINYLIWVEWIQKNMYIRTVYEEATQIAAMLNQSRQLTMLDNIILGLLSKGVYEEKVIQYDKVFAPGSLEPQFVEKGYTIRKRDLSIGELSALKIMLSRNLIKLPQGQAEDFGGMSEAELVQYISSNGMEIVLNPETE